MRERQTKQKARRTHSFNISIHVHVRATVYYYICLMHIQQIQQCVKNDKRKLLILPPRNDIRNAARMTCIIITAVPTAARNEDSLGAFLLASVTAAAPLTSTHQEVIV